MADEFLNMIKSVQSTGRVQQPNNQSGKGSVSTAKLITESADLEKLYRFNLDSESEN